MTTYYVLSRVLVSIGLAVFLSGTNYLQQWTTHRAHFVDWNKVCIPAGGMFLVFLGIGLGVPYLIRREEQKRVRKNAALEANAQNATD